MLQINNLTKQYGSFVAVDDLTLHVSENEFFGFLGPNGAGKTTTIKMIAGLLRPTKGSIAIAGYNIAENSNLAKAALGYIPDQPFLYEKLTGREFLFFSGGLFDIEYNKLKEEIDRVIELFHLGAWIDRRTDTYSQGMRQRITIASSLLHRPKLVVVDEPMVGLDPQSAKVVTEAFQEIARSGSTILMSTHSLHIAQEICTRIGILKDGKLIFDGPAEDFKEFHSANYNALENFFIELVK